MASDISAVSEIIDDGENGFMADKKGVKKFSGAVMRILYDEGLRIKFQAAGRETVKLFGALLMLNKYESLYSELAS